MKGAKTGRESDLIHAIIKVLMNAEERHLSIPIFFDNIAFDHEVQRQREES